MKFWTKQSYRDRKEVSLCLWGWGKEMTTIVYEGNLQSEGTVPYFDCGNGHMTMHLSQNSELFTKLLSFSLCKL